MNPSDQPAAQQRDDDVSSQEPLSDDELDVVAGGLNPQPIPPCYHPPPEE